MKCFRYIAGYTFRSVTEEDVRASMAKLPEGSIKRANAAEVLALEVGESVTFESGVNFTRIEDDAQPFLAFICGPRGRARKCQFCGRSVASGDGLLCDGPSSKKPGKTCDTFMCRGCGKHIARDRDLCPRCVAI